MREPTDELTLVDHLGDLRATLLRALVPLIPCAVCGVALSTDLLGWVFRAPREGGLHLYVYRLPDAMLLRIRMGVLAGLVATAPWTALQLHHFVRPGLRDSEARTARRLCLVCGTAFLAGAGLVFAATPAIVGWWAARQAADVFLDAGQYFTMWEAICLGGGCVAALCAGVPALCAKLRRRGTE